VIRAILFDLDGTLIQTEKLIARSYARAVQKLSPEDVGEAVVFEAFKEVVGRSRREVAVFLLEKFSLEGEAFNRMADFGVSSPWQAFVQTRLGYYEKLISDPAIVRQHQWGHNLALLQQARLVGCKTGLATMSHCPQAQIVLDALNLNEAFDFIVTRDDVDRGKPDPEIYLLLARELGVEPGECLVIEDSPAGVQAALAAGMMCIAVSTPFTKELLRTDTHLNEAWIVDEPSQLPFVVGKLFAEQSQVVHPLLSKNLCV
jgi:beta-phosphoglucomutase